MSEGPESACGIRIFSRAIKGTLSIAADIISFEDEHEMKHNGLWTTEWPKRRIRTRRI